MKTGFRFLPKEGAAEGTLTYGELDVLATRYAVRLRPRYEPGARVLLIHSPGLSFIAAFFGCQRAGLIAIPVCPASRHRPNDRNRARLIAAARDSQPSVILTDDRSRIPEALSPIDTFVEEDLPPLERPAAPPPRMGQGPAFVQYTSGSTRAPRGVVVSQAALLEQLEIYRQRSGPRPDKVVMAGWLPHYHDYGLIGFILSSVYMGVPYIFMPPAHFFRRPSRWLEMISRYKATYSGAPASAYDLCARSASRGDHHFDLSSWSIASLGGEPIQAEALERFAEAFAPSGFRRESFLPAYGLAEAVLCVSARQGLRVRWFSGEGLREGRGTEVEAGTPDARTLVSCGSPAPGQRVRIVDPATRRPVREGELGEVWVTGESLAEGYWRRDEETRSTFKARIVGDDSTNYLRTGDRGFLSEGELYLTGRFRDLIIDQGSNHAPEDIEWTVQTLDPAFHDGLGAAFQVDVDSFPRVVVVQEMKRSPTVDLQQLSLRICSAVAECHGLEVHAVELIKLGGLPRTTSGKVSRHACREAYLDGKLSSLHRFSRNVNSEPTHPEREMLSKAVPREPGRTGEGRITLGETESRLLALMREALPGAEVGSGDGFFKAGGDSLAAHRFLARIRESFGIEIQLRDLFEAPSVSSLAERIENAGGASWIPGSPEVEADPASAERPEEATLKPVPGQDGFDGLGPAILRQLQSLNQLMVQQVRLLEELKGSLQARDREESESQLDDDWSGEVFPLSESQLEIRYLEELAPEATAAFSVFSLVEFRAEPEIEILLRALRQLTLRHESLRTVVEDRRLQRVLPYIEPVVEQVELANHDSEGLLTWLREERARRFDVRRGPLWRATLLQTPLGHFLAVTAHHVISDGWSLKVLLSEMAEIYSKFLAGRPCELAENLQYRDFRRIQTKRRDSELLQTHEDYWTDLLGSEIPRLEFPTSDPRPDSPTFRAAAHSVTIGPELRGSAARLAADNSSTLAQVLLTAYVAVLHRFTGQDRILLGVDIANRDFDGGDLITGYCSSLLPFVTDVQGSPTATQMLKSVREGLLSAFEHRDYTLDMMLEKLRRPIDPRRPLTFTGTFNMQRLPEEAVDLFDVRFDLNALSTTRSALELSLEATDLLHSVRVDFVYGADVFDAATAARFSDYFIRVLEGICREPESPLLELPMLPEAERRVLLEDWNDTGGDRAAWQVFQELFEARVAATPNAVAVVCGSRRLTYRELNAHANRVAHFIIQQGTLPGTIVALLCRRSEIFLTAMLATFKAGGVHMPLDPRDPDERLRQQVEQGGARILLASREFVDISDRLRFQDGEADGLRLVVLEDALEQSVESGNPTCRSEPGDPAYAMFTSGSTGAPKAAIISQSGMLNHLMGKIEAVGLEAQDCLAQTAPQCFDILVWQFLAPLLVSARVHVFEDEVAFDSTRLLGEIDRHGITIFQAVPTMLHAILEAEQNGSSGPPKELSDLRWLIPTGETLPPGLCRSWISRNPRVPMLNSYGPTECSDDVAHHPIIWPPSFNTVRVPIGRPIRGARLYVLDERCQLVPIGSPGELYIGGVCVGLGYRNDPKRTVEAFVPDLFSTRPGARLYRTGDLVKYRPDGVLEFLGRIDCQAKVGGVRVDPGEIETVLRQHPAVKDCVVTTSKSGRESYLVGYVVRRSEATASVADLRGHARKWLPPLLVPASITFLEALPLNRNGKIDLAGLPEPQPPSRPAPTPPRTRVERQLVEIWSEVLKRDSIGVHDDLFDLGARSLDAAKTVARVNEAFDLDMSLAQLYREPTVAGVAAYVEAAVGQSS